MRWIDGNLGSVLEVALMVGGVIGLISWGRWRQMVSLYKGEVEALTEKVTRLEADNASKETQLHAKDKEIAGLSGQVQQLTAQVSELRSLVMQDTVPQALKKELTGLTNRVVERIAELEDNTAIAVGALGDRIIRQLPPEST